MLPWPNKMSDLERTAGSVIVCGFQGIEAPDIVLQWLGAQTVAGLILFKRNIDELEQARSLIASCHEASSSPLGAVA